MQGKRLSHFLLTKSGMKAKQQSSGVIVNQTLAKVALCLYNKTISMFPINYSTVSQTHSLRSPKLPILLLTFLAVLSPAFTRELIPFTEKYGGVLCNNNEKFNLIQPFKYLHSLRNDLYPSIDGTIRFEDSKQSNKIFTFSI